MDVDDRPAAQSAWRPASLLRTAGLTVAGLATGVLAAAITLLLTVDSVSGMGAAVALFTFLTLVPAIALGWNGNRFRRAYSSGLATCWIAAVVVLLWYLQDDEGMSPESLTEAKAQIVASGAPAYFVGDEAEGHDLDEVHLFKADQIAMFWYGESCEMGGEAGCWPSISIETRPLSWDLGAAPCRRLDPELGVPTVLLDERNALDGPVVVLFTGSSLVAIEHEAVREGGDADRALDLARLLRPVDASTAVRSLPPPSPKLLALVDRACPTHAE